MNKYKQNILKQTDKLFNYMYHGLESARAYKLISTTLSLIFLSTIFIIFLNKSGVFPEYIGSKIQDNYFFAVELVFRILLAVEIITMVFVLAYSVSESVAKQFEILSLILLRQAFKEFSYVELPLNIEDSYLPLAYILSDIFGALSIFGGIVIFKNMQKHRKITQSDTDKSKFDSVKKLLAVGMIITFVTLGIYDLIAYFNNDESFNFFTLFYTILIFTDILIVIIALRYSHSYSVVFRNTGFAVATILIRLSLSMPHYFDAALGLLAMIFVIIMNYIYNRFNIKPHHLLCTCEECEKNIENS